MKKETFVQGVTILEETFNRTLNRMIAWEILRELDDVKFMGAVRLMVKKLARLYPNDNLVAIVQEYVSEYSKKTYQEKLEQKDKNNNPAIGWEPCPPPKEWEELKKKIGGYV